MVFVVVFGSAFIVVVVVVIIVWVIMGGFVVGRFTKGGSSEAGVGWFTKVACGKWVGWAHDGAHYK